MFEESLREMICEIDGWGPADMFTTYTATQEEDPGNPEDDLFGVDPSDTDTMRSEITLDGDRYLLTVLTKALIDEMCESIPVKKALIEENDDPEINALILRREHTMLYSLANSNDPTVRFFAWVMRDGEVNERGDTKNVKVPYRPVLIPLDKEGNVDFSMRELNPDGSVVEGGQVVLTKSPGKLPFALPFATRKEELHFSDSNTHDQENLKWVWFHGLMVNLCPNITINPQTLVNQRLISEAILSSRFTTNQ